jgi:hypothetical protein
LFLARPEKILEFGSGRSTNYLAEYAEKMNVEFISIEHSWYYYMKVKTGLKLLFLDSEHVKYVPMDGDWYDIKKLDRFLAGYDNIDFLFVDGPNNLPDDVRDPQVFYDYVTGKLKNIRMVFIDDTHIELGKQLAKNMTSKFGLSRFDVEYTADPYTNRLAILLDKNSSEIINYLPSYSSKMLLKY